MPTYSEKLRDPRWQRKRLEIMNRDKFTCRHCGDEHNELQVHHRKYYSGLAPWEYHGSDLVTLCKKCHAKEGNVRKASEQYLLDVMNRKGFSVFQIQALAQLMDKYPGIVSDIKNIIDQSVNQDL